MLYCTVHALGELAVIFPVAGSFAVYGTRFVSNIPSVRTEEKADRVPCCRLTRLGGSPWVGSEFISSPPANQPLFSRMPIKHLTSGN